MEKQTDGIYLALPNFRRRVFLFPQAASAICATSSARGATQSALRRPKSPSRAGRLPTWRSPSASARKTFPLPVLRIRKVIRTAEKRKAVCESVRVASTEDALKAALNPHLEKEIYRRWRLFSASCKKTALLRGRTWNQQTDFSTSTAVSTLRKVCSGGNKAARRRAAFHQA